jgi:hypothetical protein
MVDFISIITFICKEPSNLIAFCALFVSIMSFILTIYTSWIQRNHAQLSVEPFVNIHLENLDGKIKISISNDGLGPAIIKSIETFRKGDKDQHNLGWPPNSFTKIDYQGLVISPAFMTSLENCSIINGKCIDIFELQFDVKNKNHIRAAIKTRDSLKDLTMKIKYIGMYRNKEFEVISTFDTLNQLAYLDNLI